MAQATGSNAQIIIGEESTYGTAATSGYLMKMATYGESVGASKEELISNSINASRSIQSTKAGNEDGGGSIPFELNTEGPGFIWHHLLGGTVGTTGAGPYTHVIKRGALPTSFTYEKGFTDLGTAAYHLYTGCRIESAQVSITTEGLIAGTLEIKTKGAPTTSGSSFDGTPTDNGHTVLHHADVTAMNEGGSSVTALGIEFSITNNLDAGRFTVGSATRGSLPEGKGEASGTLTIPFENETLFNKWLNATASSIDVTITNGTSSLKFDFPNVSYNGDAAPKIETAQGLVVALPFRAIYDVTDASDVVITLINGEATI